MKSFKNFKKLKEQRAFILMVVSIQKKGTAQDEGYVLVAVFILLLLTFGLLTAYSLATKVENTTTLASADSNNGFYATESGLNLRAEEIRQKFLGFNQPDGSSPASYSACTNQVTGSQGTGDFACKTYQLSAGRPDGSQHIAYTYVVQKNNGQPTAGTVPRGEPFQNLNMQEYGYQIYSIAQKANTSTPEAILEMDIKSRVVPMFQFAAFYANDLEMLPSPAMTFNGPIHTNASLYLGGDNSLNIQGQITAVGSLFNKRKNNNNTYPSGRVKVADAANNLKNLLDANGGIETNLALSPGALTSGWGSQINVGVDKLTLPGASFLDKNGDYNNKADLRIKYTPNKPGILPVPFTVTAINRSGTNPSSVELSEGQLRSLMQPVLVRNNLSDLCSGTIVTVLPAALLSLTTTQKNTIINALQVAIVSQPSPVSFSQLNSQLTLLSGINTSLASLLTSQLTLTQLSALALLTPKQVAAINGQCFTSAPIQNIPTTASNAFYNNRERQSINILQLDIRGLALWNRDGIAVNFNNGTVSGNGFSTNQVLFNRAAADTYAPAGSFQKLGLAAADQSEEGLVLYATIDPDDPDNSSISSNIKGNRSAYAFAITEGKQLLGLANYTDPSNLNPTGLTIASDQAIYLQGDYNYDSTIKYKDRNNTDVILKQPAAIMADSINVLSNACLSSDNLINCGKDGTQLTASNTIINTAFLGGTDITSGSDYNGGLENYPRFHENWSGKTLTYRGSFVSLSSPFHVSGSWSSQVYTAPTRNWNYDVNFNDAQNLPPLSPRFVYLRQEQFVRTFD